MQNLIKINIVSLAMKKALMILMQCKSDLLPSFLRMFSCCCYFPFEEGNLVRLFVLEV